jgi:hypothetical protein
MVNEGAYADGATGFGGGCCKWEFVRGEWVRQQLFEHGGEGQPGLLGLHVNLHTN